MGSVASNNTLIYEKTTKAILNIQSLSLAIAERQNTSQSNPIENPAPSKTGFLCFIRCSRKINLLIFKGFFLDIIVLL